MAQKRVQLHVETFSCLICLDLLKNPVTVPCGHSYCMKCIKRFWDEKNIYSCPQCRTTFTPRPVLGKNTILADLVKELKKNGPPADHLYAGPEDVACDVCTEGKLKALKSCLVSYCEKHLQAHYDVGQLKKHKLVEPCKNLQDNICSRYDEVMKMFCCTDQQCICYLCSVDEHKGHDTVSAAAERTERQREVKGRQQKIQRRIQDIEKDVKLLQQELSAIIGSADKEMKNSEKIFTELIHLLEKKRSDMKQLLRSQQETAVSRVKELQKKLEQEITELKRKDADLKQLSHIQNHIQFLHNYPSLSALTEPQFSFLSTILGNKSYSASASASATDSLESDDCDSECDSSSSPFGCSLQDSKPTKSSSMNSRPLRYFEDVTVAVSELRDTLQDNLKKNWTNIPLALTEVGVLLSQPEPMTRAGFLRHSLKFTLDPNTAHTQLLLSEKNRKATVSNSRQNEFYFSDPDRFAHYCQVLSRETLPKRCYWEVEWSGTGVYIAVAYKNISRAGSMNECVFGLNDKSWALNCQQNCYRFWHNIRTTVSGPQSSRIGVYLDHRAGILSFYSISKTMTLLYRVQTTFTQTLYAGLRLVGLLDGGGSAEICKFN